MRTIKCPVCRKEVPLDSPEMPFCSERCRLIDLGRWANEEYRIPAEPVHPPAPEPEDADEE
ncbi:MAG: DNA gyrase inhibitor YacG [Bryobacteraceae bacterium]|nr:DNA gyrase inhibitor YacG [Bryobacteraceae bacterium]MCX7605229.1 DNA gyrase inhibitor YacG [Bryobacteraceae bacterium]